MCKRSQRKREEEKAYSRVARDGCGLLLWDNNGDDEQNEFVINDLYPSIWQLIKEVKQQLPTSSLDN